MALFASCPDCQKRFRVPHDQKAWHCKVCNAVLEFEDSVPDEDQETEGACPECDAPIAPGDHFCDVCGASLGGGEEQVTKRKKSESVDAGVQMRSARKSIDGLRGLLRVVLVLRILGVLGAVLFVFAALSPFSGDMGLAVLFLALVGLDLGLLILVLNQLTKRPFPAALALASLATLTLVLNVFTSDAEGGLLVVQLVAGAIFPAFFWYVTVKAAKLSRLAEDFPDLFLSRRMRGEHEARRSRGSGGSVSQRSRERIQRDKRPPYVVLSVLGAVLVGVITYGLLNRPSSPEEVVVRLGVAWNEKDITTMATFVPAESRAKWARQLERIPEIYDWGEEWPAITEYVYEVDEEVVQVKFLTEAGTLPFRMRWTREDGWLMYQMSFKDVKDWKRP